MVKNEKIQRFIDAAMSDADVRAEVEATVTFQKAKRELFDRIFYGVTLEELHEWRKRHEAERES